MTFATMTTDELYQRIKTLANDATDFDIDQQEYYVNEMRSILDELELRIQDSLVVED